MPEKKKILERKNILITGGAGFIGSHLCDELIKDNNIICLDNFSSGRIENISHLLQNPNFEFIKHDLNNKIDLNDFHELDKFKIKFQGVDEVYHLATPTSPKNFDKYKIDTLKTNSLGVINALEVAKKHKAKFLLASSVVVYGPRFDNAPLFTEDYRGYVDITGQRSCYDEGKRFSETAVATYNQTYSMEAKIARIFRTYGPRLSLFDGHMIPDFVLQAINDKPMQIFGGEQFTTSLCYVSDIVEGLTKFMKSTEIGPFNFGHYEEYKMSAVAEKIKTMINSKSEIQFKESMVFMTPLGLPDISKVKAKLGWYPLISLDSGLEKTIEYVRASKDILRPMLWKYEDES